jgi:hypothetical protein
MNTKDGSQEDSCLFLCSDLDNEDAEYEDSTVEGEENDKEEMENVHNKMLACGKNIYEHLMDLDIIKQKKEAAEDIQLFIDIIAEYCPLSNEAFNLLFYGDTLDGKTVGEGSPIVGMFELAAGMTKPKQSVFYPSTDQILHAVNMMEIILQSDVWSLIINTDLLIQKIAKIIRNILIDNYSGIPDISLHQVEKLKKCSKLYSFKGVINSTVESDLIYDDMEILGITNGKPIETYALITISEILRLKNINKNDYQNIEFTLIGNSRIARDELTTD